MRDILEPDYDQILLLPPALEDWIGAEHPARFIRQLVEQNDLRALGVKLPDAQTGGSCYAPGMLLAVWLYGYCRGVRSTRKLETACREEMGFVWLSGNLRPDHNALWRFWNTNREALARVFTLTVRVAVRLGLVGFALEAVDGSKTDAVCAARQRCSREGLESALQRAEQKVERLEAALHAEGSAQPAPEDNAALPPELRRARALREKVSEALRVVQRGEKNHCHPQEPEATRLVMADGGNRFGYNAQVCVDGTAAIITAAVLETHANDCGLLLPVSNAAKENTGKRAEHTLADTGYVSTPAIGEAESAGVNLIMPLRESMTGEGDQPYHHSRFRYDADTDAVHCPEDRMLHFHHARLRHGEHPVRVYRNPAACRECPVRAQCTKDKAGRAIDITPHHQAVARHREKMQRPEAQSLYRKRSGLVEPVFARAKTQSGFKRFTVRGRAKAAVQWALVCTGYNLMRLYRACRGAWPAAAFASGGR